MMFRRRTTDQVYATLQQVQRRITEQGAGSAPPAGARPLGQIAPRPLQTNQGLGAMPGASASGMNGPNLRPAAFPGGPDDEPTAPQLAMASAVPVYPRGTLHLPLQLAITLFLLWLGSVIVATILGMRMGGRADHAEVAEPARPVAEKSIERPADPEPAPGKRLGDSILVLNAVPSFTPQTRQQWQIEVDRLNAYMKQKDNEAKGWKPYFALREPENGGLQFVYGFANGQYGIDRSKFEDLARQLAPYYKSAKWLAVD